MIGALVPGVVNALQVTIPGRSPSVSSVKVLGNARDEKKAIGQFNMPLLRHQFVARCCDLLFLILIYSGS